MRSRAFRRIPALLTFVLAMAVGLCAQSLQVTRGYGTSATLTAAQITALPHVSVNVKDHDTPAQFEGVPLSAVLALPACSWATACADRAWPRPGW